MDMNPTVAWCSARKVIGETARAIRERRFDLGPRFKPRDPKLYVRCGECDHLEFCPREEARRYRSSRRSRKTAGK